MKFIFTLAIGFITTLSSAQISFKTSLGGAFAHCSFNDMTELADGSYVGVGYYTNGIQGLYIAKLSSHGQLVQTRLVKGDSLQPKLESYITKTFDSGFIVCATLNDTVQVLKFNNQLNLQWNKQYTNITANAIRLIQTKDSEYIMGGVITHSSSKNVSFIAKLNDSGDVVYVKQYALTSNSVYLTNIQQASNGDYVFAAQSRNVADTALLDIMVWRTDNTGNNILWSKQISIDSNVTTGVHNPLALLAAADGSVIVTGVADYFSPSFTAELTLSKFDKSGNYLWSRRSNYADTGSVYGLAITEASSSGYVISGQINALLPCCNNISGYILKTDTSGFVQTTKAYYYALYNTYFKNGLINTSDGGYAVAGLQIIPPGLVNNAIIYKFAPDFSICGSNASVGNLQNLVSSAHNVSINISDTTTINTISNIVLLDSAGGANDVCSGILATKILSFNAVLQSNNEVLVNWKTANAEDADHFIIEKSNKANSFAALKQVNAAGNSVNVQVYNFTDKAPLNGTSYYRLKQVDKDGKILYSSIAQIIFNNDESIVIESNPVINNVHINMQSRAAGKRKIIITDMAGKVLMLKEVLINQGANNIILQTSSLFKGVYIIKIIDDNTKTHVLQFVKN